MKNWHRRIKLSEETNAPFGVGSFTAGSVLLIGEQASDPTTAPEQRPFCDDKGCSGWLNKLLEANDIPEEMLFWVNALNNDGSQIDIRKIVQTLLPLKVIALGKVAQRVCQQQQVHALSVYHPQYWKRFRSKEQYPLINELRSLTNYRATINFANGFLAVQ